MTIDEECPIDAVEEALELATQIEVDKIPVDFDPGDLRWNKVLAKIAHEFSNHGALLEELLDTLEEARVQLPQDCEFVGAHADEDPIETCKKCWLAKYRLWEAALDAAEKAYQRWLARQALRRAAGCDV